MSKEAAIYLLRLRQEYRFNGDRYYYQGWRNPNNSPFQKAFASRSDAIAWSINNPPVASNPFDQSGFFAGHYRFYYDYNAGRAEEEEIIAFEFYEPLPERTELVAIRQGEFPESSGSEMTTMFVLDWLRQIIGVIPPSLDLAGKEEVWVQWWNEGAGGADIEQKKEIWRFFVPLPYLLTEIECIGERMRT